MINQPLFPGPGPPLYMKESLLITYEQSDYDSDSDYNMNIDSIHSIMDFMDNVLSVWMWINGFEFIIK